MVKDICIGLLFVATATIGILGTIGAIDDMLNKYK